MSKQTTDQIISNGDLCAIRKLKQAGVVCNAGWGTGDGGGRLQTGGIERPP